MGFKKNKVKNTFSRQDENWELMTIIGVPWTECDKISDEDRNYLLARATEIKVHLEAEQEKKRQQEKDYVDQIVANAKPNPDSAEPPSVKLGANY